MLPCSSCTPSCPEADAVDECIRPPPPSNYQLPPRACSPLVIAKMGGNMSEDTREKYLKIALVVFGVIFLLIYPLGLI